MRIQIDLEQDKRQTVYQQKIFTLKRLILTKVEFMSERFIGTWKLVSYENRSGDPVAHPLGKNPVGYIMYNNGGYMAVALMASNRKKFNVNGYNGWHDRRNSSRI